MLHMDKKLSPPSKPPRVSVPVSAEVLIAFERLGKASGMSTGKAIAEWLADTLEAIEFMATKVEQARAAPKLVMAEMHAYALGLADETGALMRQLQEKGKASRAASAGARPPPPAASPFPPSCNTGGKLPNTAKPKKAIKPGFPLPPALIQAYADTNGVPPKGKK